MKQTLQERVGHAYPLTEERKESIGLSLHELLPWVKEIPKEDAHTH